MGLSLSESLVILESQGQGRPCVHNTAASHSGRRQKPPPTTLFCDFDTTSAGISGWEASGSQIKVQVSDP